MGSTEVICALEYEGKTARRDDAGTREEVAAGGTDHPGRVIPRSLIWHVLRSRADGRFSYSKVSIIASRGRPHVHAGVTDRSRWEETARYFCGGRSP